MYELIKLTENDYYIDCPSKIGVVYTGGGRAVFIDSGNDSDAAKKALRAIGEKGWELEGVFCTHSHADHIGGCAYLESKTGCGVFANALEVDFANHTVLEPIALMGGCPLEAVSNKFFIAKPSRARQFTDSDLPDGMKAIDLCGHSPDMAGYMTKDGSAYIGDCVASRETLEKYGIAFLYDVEKSLRSLEYIKTLEASRFIASHAPVCEDIKELANINISAINRVADTVVSLLSSPMIFEELLAGLFRAYSLNANASQYALIGSTLRSYLAYLSENGRASFDFIDGKMIWRVN